MITFQGEVQAKFSEASRACDAQVVEAKDLKRSHEEQLGQLKSLHSLEVVKLQDEIDSSRRENGFSFMLYVN
jgi:hypothetical protein